jgi:hypothetical protein
MLPSRVFHVLYPLEETGTNHLRAVYDHVCFSIQLSRLSLFAMPPKQANRQAITLKGSTALVTEFFKYAVNT